MPVITAIQATLLQALGLLHALIVLPGSTHHPTVLQVVRIVTPGKFQMHGEQVALAATQVLTTMHGAQQRAMRVAKDNMLTHMEAPGVRIAHPVDIQISMDFRLAINVEAESIRHNKVLLIATIALVDSIRIKTVKRVAKAVVQEFILQAGLLVALIAQPENTILTTGSQLVGHAMEVNTNGITRPERLLLAGDAENAKGPIRIAQTKELAVATWKGILLQIQMIEQITSSFINQI